MSTLNSDSLRLLISFLHLDRYSYSPPKLKANLILFFPDGEEYLGGKRTHNNTLSGSTYFVNHFNLNLISSVYIFDLLGGSFDNKITLTIDNLNKFDDFYQLYKQNRLNY